MSQLVTYSRKGAIGFITVDNPPVNALSVGVRRGIVDCLKQGADDADAKALVLICAGRTFIAGADITEFGRPLEEPDLNAVIAALENSPKPVIAAIHGTALGGGLETALGCHYRCAAPSAQVGLPEVKLGIVPGAGGTQRLPRIAGVKAALEMITGGDPIPAAKAHALGIVDEIIDEKLEGAAAFAEKVVAEKRPLRRIRDLHEKLAEGKQSPGIFDEFRKVLAQTKRGFEAPQRGVDAVEAAVTLPFDKGLEREREIFGECLFSPQSFAQRHIFFAERQVSKIPDIPKDQSTLPIRSAAVIGAGTMGGGIAMNFVNAGIPVVLIDSSQEFIDKGLGVIKKNYANTVSKGKLTQEKMDQRMGLITPATSYDAIKNVDIVVEAVFEEMDIKKEVFKKLDAVCKPEAILATNTSTLDVNEIAAATSRPDKVIGLHFFSPANVMKLLEIVRAEKTSKETLATALALAKTIKKVGVVVGVCDGFVGNRMIHGYVREAMFLLEEGALPQQVDKVLYDFGFPMGPLQMSDLAGLDVGWRIRKRQAATRPKDERYSAIGDKLCEQGRYGQKTGAGFYKYEPGNRSPISDPEVESLIVAESKAQGITRRDISDEEILKRCIYPLINEGARILEEGIALRASDIDVIYIYGYGFPVFRGGPMFYADSTGVDSVCGDVRKFFTTQGKLWEVAPLLERMAREGKNFTV
ncbi:MAG: 3-hydroxyacyl-CoA dehydrogenase NAD-binding domain-containing protein [Candidatus Hydrogenedentes bacterium]|nr:3-hydroxyacyl-CoA dehydrogenase NAD-binding domain-containing protein [Candidatus Hydrogenedentota bacterium]